MLKCLPEFNPPLCEELGFSVTPQNEFSLFPPNNVSKLFSVKFITVTNFSSCFPELHPTKRQVGLKIVFRWPRSLTPSSIMRLRIVISAVFLSFMSKSAPMISAMAPGPFLQCLRILSLKLDPSLPRCPNIPLRQRSLLWSEADLVSPWCLLNGGRDFCTIRKFLASIHTLLPSLVSYSTPSVSGISRSLTNEPICFQIRGIKQPGYSLARLRYLRISSPMQSYLFLQKMSCGNIQMTSLINVSNQFDKISKICTQKQAFSLMDSHLCSSL